MDKVKSRDGTAIAFDKQGDGPAVIFVDGAMSTPSGKADLARLLAPSFTVYAYDRRGRGDSGDTEPYAVEREIEDLAAVIGAAGASGPVFAHAISSGAGLLFRALAAGSPVRRASVLEPPYRVPGAPPAPERYIETLRSFVAAEDRDGLVEYFQTQVIGLPAPMVASMKGTPAWQWLCAIAPTLVYDGLVMGGDDQSLPVDLLGGIEIPVLAVT